MSSAFMTFWITTTAMTALIVLLLLRAIWRGSDKRLPDPVNFDVQVYRDQLAEVDHDVARGVVAAADTEPVRAEIARRILAADAATKSDERKISGRPLVLMLVLPPALIVGTAALYLQLGQPGYGDLALADRIAFAEEMRENRPSQQAAEASLPPAPATQDFSADFLNLMAQLRATVADRPNDLQGHRLLAQNEANMGNYAAAARAQKDVLRMMGDNVSVEELGNYGELLVLAAGGYVSPQAETVLRSVLSRDIDNGRARYYLGLMMAQTGRPDTAFRIWDGLLRRGPADAPWIAPIREQIMPLSRLAGVDYTLPNIGSGAAKGPSAADIDAASEMTADERMEMIGGMVAGLSDRLASEGGPPGDWARLITSLAVLGDRDQALAVYDNAIEVFAGNAGAIDIIRAAGSQAGVAE